MAKSKKKKHEDAVVAAVAVSATANGEQEKVKKKKYERSVRIRNAGEVAKFLVYNAKNFRGRYEGNALYSIKVDIDDKAFLDDLLDRLEHCKK